MNPTQRQFVREQLELIRVGAHQRLHHWDQTLLAVEDDRGSLLDLRLTNRRPNRLSLAANVQNKCPRHRDVSLHEVKWDMNQ